MDSLTGFGILFDPMVPLNRRQTLWPDSLWSIDRQRMLRTILRKLGVTAAHIVMGGLVCRDLLLRRGLVNSISPYLHRRFPARTSPLQRLRDALRLTHRLGSCRVDQLALELLGTDALTVTSPDEREIDRLLQNRNGLLLMTAHLGAWSAGVSWVQRRKPHGLMASLSSGREQEIELMELVRRGWPAAIVGDQPTDDPAESVVVRLWDENVRLPLLPYRLASTTGAPIAVVLSRRSGFRRYECLLAATIEVPAGLGRETSDFAPYAQQFADALAAFAKEYPWQVFVPADLWPKPVVAETPQRKVRGKRRIAM